LLRSDAAIVSPPIWGHIMKLFRLAFALAALMAVSACATTNFEHTKSLQSGTEMSGTSLVVYSFLGIREDHFGKDMLAMMNGQLVAQFKQQGVNARIVVYEHSPVQNDYKSLLLGPNHTTSVAVPIKEYMASQRPAELKNGDQYRLIVFPSLVTTMGANIDSNISWTLIDTKTDKPVWTTKQNTSRTVWWNQDEAPETRSKQFVDGIMKQMTSSGLFGTAAADQMKLQELQKAKEKAKPIGM
jgi:hypothetical protein